MERFAVGYALMERFAAPQHPNPHATTPPPSKDVGDDEPSDKQDTNDERKGIYIYMWFFYSQKWI